MKKTIILILMCLSVLTVAFCWGYFVTQMFCLIFNDNPLLVATFAIPISFFGGYFISDMCLKIYKKYEKR